MQAFDRKALFSVRLMTGFLFGGDGANGLTVCENVTGWVIDSAFIDFSNVLGDPTAVGT